ncbi:MAG: hypothetical protein IH591_06380 [Bacteroidales bacterium]|nr:hypothetical protein [Bacteroidales bacterium]
MKKLLITLTAVLFISLMANGQNLFFFGDKSYPCTETFTLESNSDSDDLSILFARDGTISLVIVSIRPTLKMFIKNDLFIYLDDGTVIKCVDRGKFDYVDYIAISVYYLSNEDLTKLKSSNINTVRFTVKSDDLALIRLEGNFTASNNGDNSRIDFPAVINSFYK